jgi:hypothetical protein
MRPDMHAVDPKMASMVPAEDDFVHDAGLDGYGESSSAW